MATDMDRAYDDDELVYRCDGCGGVLEPWDAEPPVIYDCFHVLHAGCAHGRDACPRCQTPRRVDDDHHLLQPEPVDDAAPASPTDEDSSLASDDAGVGMGSGETGEPRPSRCGGEFKPGNGESPTSMSGSGCNHASRLGCCACCSRRVAELESRFQEKSAALTETTNVLESKLESARSRLCRLEEMHNKLEEELIRLRDGKRPREIEDAAMEWKKPRNGGAERLKFPTGPD